MKNLFTLFISLSLLCLISGCGGVFEPGYIDKGPPTNAEAFKKPSANVSDTIKALEECGDKTMDLSKSWEFRTNDGIRLRMCMDGKGFKLDGAGTIRDSCLRTYKYEGFKPPVCVARGYFN